MLCQVLLHVDRFVNQILGGLMLTLGPAEQTTACVTNAVSGGTLMSSWMGGYESKIGAPSPFIADKIQSAIRGQPAGEYIAWKRVSRIMQTPGIFALGTGNGL